MILCKFHPPLSKDFRNRLLTALDAVRNTHPSVAAARNGETGNLDTPAIDPCYPLEVSEERVYCKK